MSKNNAILVAILTILGLLALAGLIHPGIFMWPAIFLGIPKLITLIVNKVSGSQKGADNLFSAEQQAMIAKIANKNKTAPLNTEKEKFNDTHELRHDELFNMTQSAMKRAKTLFRMQLALTVICWSSLIYALVYKLLGGSSKVTMALAMLAAICGFGSWIVGRKAEPFYVKFAEIQKIIELTISSRNEKKIGESYKIPLTIGFANFSGDDCREIVLQDTTTLSPLFLKSKKVPDNKVPRAEIIFVYANLNEDGTIKGQGTSGIRQIVQLTNASIVILASPNSPQSIKNAISLPGPKTANLIFTLDRNGSGFGMFFLELFNKMRGGKEMMAAWVELSPQSPGPNLTFAPQTIFVAEAGKIAFPKQG